MLEVDGGDSFLVDSDVSSSLYGDVQQVDGSNTPSEGKEVSRRLVGFGAMWRAATLLSNRAFLGLDRESLAGEKGDLWRMQQRALTLRGQVRLCLKPPGTREHEGGVSIILNRPLSWSKSIAELVTSLGHTDEADTLSESPQNKGVNGIAPSDVLRVFGSRPILYKGGDIGMDGPALCMHGLTKTRVPGSVELVRGTGVFTANVATATAAVLRGTARADDFRIFVGHCRDLNSKMIGTEWQAVACCRPLVLKQCRSLPVSCIPSSDAQMYRCCCEL